MLDKVQLQEYKHQLLADFNSRTHYDQGRFYAPVGHRLIQLANLQRGQKVLDMATGTGIVAFAAAKIIGAEGKAIGVDISTGMLNQAKHKLELSGLQNLEFVEADAEDLNYPDNSFDVVLCSLAICYLTDISKAFSKWYRWLKLGGILVFNAWAETAFTPSVLFREVAQRYGIQVPNPNEILGTVERCHQLLERARFKDIEVREEQFGWYFHPDANNAEDIWKINAKNVFGYQVCQLSLDKLEECKTEYVEEIQKLPVTEKGAWCDAPIFFVVARKQG
jgi:ubiquinone/menaquinone biosynthesis C-methylase UbiE